MNWSSFCAYKLEKDDFTTFREKDLGYLKVNILIGRSGEL